jgi:hypothetical protein
MATSDSSGVQRWRVRLDGNRPRTHPSPKPRRKPARKPSASKSGPVVAICTIRSPISPAPRGYQRRRRYRRSRTQSAELRTGRRHRAMTSLGKEHGACIWKRDVQVLTVLAANRTSSPGVCPSAQEHKNPATPLISEKMSDWICKSRFKLS